MSYQEQAEKAEKKGNTEQVNHDIKSWNEPNETIIGRVMEIKPFTGGKYDNEVNTYIIDTDDGLTSTILGAATDKMVDQSKILHKVVKITFLGKITLPDDRPCNKFKVVVIPDA